jgi:hypothetical protein
MFAVFMFAHANVEMTYGALVLPYCVSRLGMSESTGNRVAFAYWTSFSLGRFAAIFATRPPIGPERLLTASVAINVASLAVLVAVGELPPVAGGDAATMSWWSSSSAAAFVVWPCSAALGLGVSTVFGQTIGLLAIYSSSAFSSSSTSCRPATVSARRLSVLLFAYAVGCIVGPTAAGAAFGRLGHNWMPRYTLGAALASAAALGAMRLHRCRVLQRLQS